MAFVDCLDCKPSAPQPMDIAGPAWPRMVERRAAVFARDDKRVKRPSQAAVEASPRAIGHDADGDGREGQAFGGLQRIARKLRDDASTRRRKAEAARDDASGAGKVDGLMIVLPRVCPCEQRQGSACTQLRRHARSVL